MKLQHLFALPLTLALAAQTPPAAPPAKAKAPAKAPAAAKTAPAAKPDPKAIADAQSARKALEEVLLAVDGAWFGDKYKNVNAVDMQGALSFTVTASTINTQVEQATQGVVKGSATKSGNATLRIKSTYFANADFKTEATGDFGNLVWTRRGNNGFLYSKELNAYTTNVDRPPLETPITFLAWFRETILDIKAVYITSNTFRATLGKDEGKDRASVIFDAPTGAYDPKKREQSLGDTLGFWKRGHLELTYDKASKLPQILTYSNEANGIRTRFDFTYDGSKRIQTISIANQSRGMEGPGFLRFSYNGDGQISAFAGELNEKTRKTIWDLSMSWAKDKKSAAIAAVPPPGARKLGRDELETGLLVGLAGQVMDLQRNGWNLRAPKLASR
jgi:hypothetical protein